MPYLVTLLSWFFSTVMGGVTGVLVMGELGARTGRAQLGAVLGGLLGACVSVCVRRGLMSLTTLAAIAVGLLGCLIGPGYDDYAGIGGMLYALIGAGLGYGLEVSLKLKRRPAHGDSGDQRLGT